MKYYLQVLKNYAVFSGRARRSEYWYYTLFTFIFLVVATIIDNILGITFAGGYGYFYLIYSLATFIPSLAVLVRRLHDIGKSGWFFFVILIPIAGPIWLLVLLCLDSDPGANKYGNNPKGVTSFNDEALDSHLTN